MKKKTNSFQFLLIVILLNLGTTALFANSWQNQEFQNKVDTLNQNNIVCYEVFGMDCPGCQSALEKQIKKIDGVKDAKASWQKKEVVITIQPDKTVNEEAIFKRIKKANFTPGEKIVPSNK